MRTLLRSKVIWGLLLGAFVGVDVAILICPTCGFGLTTYAPIGGATGLILGLWLDARAGSKPLNTAATGDGESE